MNKAAVVGGVVWMGLLLISIAFAKQSYDKHREQNRLEELCQDYGDAGREVAEAWPGLSTEKDFESLFGQVRKVHPKVPEKSLVAVFEYMAALGEGKSPDQVSKIVKMSCLKAFQDQSVEV